MATSWPGAAYAALMLAGLVGALFGAGAPIAPFSFGWPLILAGVVAMGLTGLMALALDGCCLRGSGRAGRRSSW